MREDGRLEIFVKWEPHCHCHFRQHNAKISSLVLEVGLNVTGIDVETGREISPAIRAAKDFAHKEPGHVHMEREGPAGALVLFPSTLLTAKASSLNLQISAEPSMVFQLLRSCSANADHDHRANPAGLASQTYALEAERWKQEDERFAILTWLLPKPFQ